MIASILAAGPNATDSAIVAASVAISGVPIAVAAVRRPWFVGRRRTQQLANRNLAIYTYLNAAFLVVAIGGIVTGISLISFGAATGPALLAIFGGGGFGAISLLFSEGSTRAQDFAMRSVDQERIEVIATSHLRIIDRALDELERGPARDELLSRLALNSSEALQEIGRAHV